MRRKTGHKAQAEEKDTAKVGADVLRHTCTKTIHNNPNNSHPFLINSKGKVIQKNLNTRIVNGMK